MYRKSSPFRLAVRRSFIGVLSCIAFSTQLFRFIVAYAVAQEVILGVFGSYYCPLFYILVCIENLDRLGTAL